MSHSATKKKAALKRGQNISREDSSTTKDINDCFQLTVLNNAGKTITIKIGLNETMRNLKAKIQDKCEIPLDKQSFSCFDQRTSSKRNDKMQEIMTDIKNVRDDLLAMYSDMNDAPNESKNIDEYEQEHDFDGHESYHGEKDEAPSTLNSEEIPTLSDEKDDSRDSDEISSENEEGDKRNSLMNENLIDDSENRNENVSTSNNMVNEANDEDDTSVENGANDSTNENEEFDSNQSDEEETEMNENAEPSQSSPNSRSKQKKIISAQNYRIETVYRGGKPEKQLLVFDIEDKSLCYIYTSKCGREKYFICNPCRNENHKRRIQRTCVSASLITNENGEECVKLNGNEHICERQKFIPQTIIDKSRYELVEKKHGGRDIKRLRYYTSDDKSSFYSYSWKNRDSLYMCIPCDRIYKIFVTAHIMKDGKQNCVLSATEHQCQPHKCVPAKSASRKRQHKYRN